MFELKKYVLPTFGVAAFVLGGLFARQKAFEAVDQLKEILSKELSD